LTRPCGSERIVQSFINRRRIGLFGLILFSATSALAQGTPSAASKTLVVNGKTVAAEVKEINGRSYVDLEALAQITNGVVTVEPNRIVLTLPTSNSTDSANAAPPPPVPRLSKDFASAAVGVLADMREWRGAIGTMITFGLVVSDAWSQQYHDKVEAGLDQAAVVATTESDQNSLPLLRNEFDKLTAWANETLAARQALNGAKTIDPNALKNDPALAAITNCSRFLNGMIVSGAYSDNAACH
jgi:hypothetical protein